MSRDTTTPFAIKAPRHARITVKTVLFDGGKGMRTRVCR
jgi:hypothetical protein